MFIINNIEQHLESIEQNTALLDETQFAQRTDVLHALEVHLLDALLPLMAAYPQDARIAGLHARAHALYNTLTQINEQLFQRFRTHIAAGTVDHARLLHDWGRLTQHSLPHTQDDLGYDSFDVLINGIVHAEAPPEEPSALEAEMVFYQPTPMRLIVELIQQAHLDHNDVFYDLGSGLGQVAIVVALLSGARTVGIEIDAHYCAYAQRCAARLNLHTVEFRNEDARATQFAGGTLFYLYTPFRGTVLQTVLDRLHREAEQRTIRVCTYGPCTATVAQQRWLTPTNRAVPNHDRITVFQSRAP